LLDSSALPVFWPEIALMPLARSNKVTGAGAVRRPRGVMLRFYF
jgi:hypothetical protein